MLDQNSKLNADKSIEGVLISSELNKAYNQQTKKMVDTQKYISRLMRNTHNEADEIRKFAYQKGFEQGFLDVLDGFNDFIVAKNNLLTTIFQLIETSIKRIFTDFLQNDTVLLAILNQSIKEHSLFDATRPTIVFLPCKKKTSTTLIKGIERILSGCHYKIAFHDTDRYIIKNHDQVIELNENEKIEQLKNSVHHRLELTRQLAQFQNQARQNFITKLSTSIGEIRCMDGES